MIYNSDIESTDTYKAIKDQLVKRILLSKESKEQISHGVNISKNVSPQKWISDFQPSKRIQSIVNDLINK